jgi:hypothetical protein
MVSKLARRSQSACRRAPRRPPSRRVRGKNTAQRPKKRRPNGLSDRLSARPFNAP